MADSKIQSYTTNPIFRGTVNTYNGSFRDVSNLHLSTLPSSVEVAYPFVMTDANRQNVFYFNVARYPDGTVYLNFVIDNENNGQHISNIVFSINMSKTGVIGYTIPNPTAFKQALGIS